MRATHDGWTAHEGKFGGTWFLFDSPSRIEVIAPPGVRITFDERCDPFAPGSVPGWRVLRVDDDRDIDPSSLVSAKPRPASTLEVVDLLGPPWIIEIKRVLLGQLEVARSFGKPRDGGPIDDELALASAVSTDWLLKELRDAFPDEPWELPGAAMTHEDIPHYSDDLLRLIPMPSRHVTMQASPSNVGSAQSEPTDPRLRELLGQVRRMVLARIGRTLRRLVEEPRLTMSTSYQTVGGGSRAEWQPTPTEPTGHEPADPQATGYVCGEAGEKASRFEPA